MVEDLNAEQLIEMFRKLLKIRLFEQEVEELHKRAQITGSFHSSMGQEAVPVGVCASLQPTDYITSTHRGHGHLIAKGGSLNAMMAELFSRETGYCKARGGSMHLTDLSIGMIGENGIVGAGLPLAVGVSLCAQMKKAGQVVACFFGDGAVGQGIFHESLNLASLWNLPVVFVCENNQYAHSMPVGRMMKRKDIAGLAIGYEMPGVQVDGNDVLAVYEASRCGVARARAGEGPSLIECVTYRWKGHHLGDPDYLYRSREEVARRREEDPVARFKARLIEMGILTEECAQEVERQAEEAIDAAISFACHSSEPEVESALEDIYIQ